MAEIRVRGDFLVQYDDADPANLTVTSTDSPPARVPWHVSVYAFYGFLFATTFVSMFIAVLIAHVIF